MKPMLTKAAIALTIGGALLAALPAEARSGHGGRGYGGFHGGYGGHGGGYGRHGGYGGYHGGYRHGGYGYRGYYGRPYYGYGYPHYGYAYPYSYFGYGYPAYYGYAYPYYGYGYYGGGDVALALGAGALGVALGAAISSSNREPSYRYEEVAPAGPICPDGLPPPADGRCP